MTRPQHQVTDVRPADHQPHRPGWTCTQCGSDWPCQPYRNHLLERLDPGAIQSVMQAHQAMMLAEFREERVVHERLFAWARHAVVRAPGGPL